MKEQDLIPAIEIDTSEFAEVDLYQKREKIYTRQIEGFFQRIRLFTGWPLLLGYFVLPWLTWDGRPAVLFDLPARQFHIFGITLWPQDLPLLAWLLIIAALALFMVTMWAGRVWCGYTCPQTVWTAIYMWAEQVAEGSRNQRIKLDQSPWSTKKVARKGLKHAMWLGFAFLTGATFIGYFTPMRELMVDLFILDAHYWSYAWTIFFTGATYINAGWLREQVCIYMCPYARFQAAMFDRDTLIVSYDKKRGDPRGARRPETNLAEAGLGDCTDCHICVQVCPTGIDIRDGLQYECINCALCIDACNAVMDKMGYARGLISYTTENALDGQGTHMLRPRLLGYGAILVTVLGLFVYTVLTRVPVGLDVVRERTQLYRETSEGLIENTYLLNIRNMTQAAYEFEVSMEGLAGATLIGTTVVNVDGGEVRELPVRLTIDPAVLPASNVDIEFAIQATDKPTYRATAESRFLGPRLPR